MIGDNAGWSARHRPLRRSHLSVPDHLRVGPIRPRVAGTESSAYRMDSIYRCLQLSRLAKRHRGRLISVFPGAFCAVEAARLHERSRRGRECDNVRGQLSETRDRCGTPLSLRRRPTFRAESSTHLT